MSGPKVVRIVTREELVDICLGHIARVDAALGEWTRVSLRNECVSEADVAAAKGRRDKLVALLEADRFQDVQKIAPREEGFLRDDLDARLAKAVEREARARSRERRGAEAARALLRALRDAGKTIDSELEKALNACAAGKGDAGALSRGFALLGSRGTGGALGPSERATALAGKLRGDAPDATFAEWVERNAPPETNPAIARLELRLAEIDRYGDDNPADGLRRRLAAAGEEVDPGRRALMLDGLEVESGRVLKDLRARARAASELDGALAELDASGAAGAAELRLGSEAVAAGELEARTERARKLLADHRSAAAAARRRDAVLEGLAALGYEVTEGMSTSWVEEGRLVARSASRPDYGVEIAGDGAGERLQMRPVAFTAAGTGPDPARDRDAETLWCGDVAGLQERLACDGGGLVVEKSRPVGAVPLKRIEGAGRTPEAVAEVPSARARTLR